MDKLEFDKREARNGWAPGFYYNSCYIYIYICSKLYLGAESSIECADCAYNTSLEQPNITSFTEDTLHKLTTGKLEMNDIENLMKKAHEILNTQSNPIAEAMEVIEKALKDDPSYAHSWHCNLAMACNDSMADKNQALTGQEIHNISNEAASRFMQLCFGIETSNDMLSNKVDLTKDSLEELTEAFENAEVVRTPIYTNSHVDREHTTDDLDIGDFDSIDVEELDIEYQEDDGNSNCGDSCSI